MLIESSKQLLPYIKKVAKQRPKHCNENLSVRNDNEVWQTMISDHYIKDDLSYPVSVNYKFDQLVIYNLSKLVNNNKQ